jgi:hypothetical protein
MANKQMGDLLNKIGQITADILEKTPKDIFVYADAGDNNSGGAIFENLQDKVIYHSFNNEMFDTIIKLWDIAEPEKKWSVLLYDIKDGKFEAEFLYTDDLEKDVFEHDYREDALVARYGDKPVIYPPMEGDEYRELTEEELAEINATEYDWDTGEALPKN